MPVEDLQCIEQDEMLPFNCSADKETVQTGCFSLTDLARALQTRNLHSPHHRLRALASTASDGSLADVASS